uniref:ER membrane protein complex subunit 6 n=1 Tax=Noctiluca scintillans TaxID=2966 RepID=A0A7S0ZNZ5_NOCSC
MAQEPSESRTLKQLVMKKPAKAPIVETTKDGRNRGKFQEKFEDGEFLNIAALQHNVRALGHSRVSAGIVAGCVAGLLKFEGLSGLCVFVLITVLHSLMILTRMGLSSRRHFPRTHDVFLNQFSHGLLSFILFWTLAYDMVHIF